MTKRGVLIVLAGIDGSGKGTQTDILCERLRAEGRDVVTFDFPRYETSFFGRMAGRYLRGEFGDGSQVDPHLASLLYAGDRFEARDAMREALDAGKVIVCNRYVSANMAHQGGKIADAARRAAFYDWVLEMEHDVFALPRPDLCLLLDVPVEVSAGLVEAKPQRAYLEGAAKDIHEADTSHLANARRAYLEIADRSPAWRIIPCAPDGAIRPKEAIAEDIWKAVAEAL